VYEFILLIKDVFPRVEDSLILVHGDSSVGLATGYGLDGRGSFPGRGKRFVSSPQRPDRLWGPPSHLTNGYRGAFSLVVKRPGSKADYSPPSSVEIKNDGAIPPFAIHLHGVLQP
jgi:hypothetical protein